MELEKIAQELAVELQKLFPFVRVSNTRDYTISVIVSNETPDQWGNGILENSRYVKMLVFCNTRSHKYHPDCTLMVDFHSGYTRGLRNKNVIVQDKVVQYIVNQFKKIA